MSTHRIISLIASATEIVCALGFENKLVGRSHECDFPDSIKQLPICTEPKFNTQGTSLEIDQRVKAILSGGLSKGRSATAVLPSEEALSIYRVHAKVLKELKPDVIITQSQCEVCAVSLRDVERAVCEMIDSRPEIVSLEPNALSDIWKDIHLVAEALEVPDRGRNLINRFRRRMSEISEKARTLHVRPTVALVEWIDPLMAAGNWMPELVELVGGENLFSEAGKHSPWMEWQDIVKKDPDIVIIAPCGFDIARSQKDLPVLKAKLEWPYLKAVKENQVYVVDGNQYFNRPGPRVVESLEILAEILNPKVFHFGHEGKGWQRL